MAFNIKELTKAITEKLKEEGVNVSEIGIVDGLGDTSHELTRDCREGNVELAYGIGATLNKMQCDITFSHYAIHGILTDLDTRSSMYKNKIEGIEPIARDLVDKISKTIDEFTDATPTLKESTIERQKEIEETIDPEYIDSLDDSHSISLIIKYTAIAVMYKQVLHEIEHVAGSLMDFAKNEAMRKRLKLAHERHLVTHHAKKNISDLD